MNYAMERDPEITQLSVVNTPKNLNYAMNIYPNFKIVVLVKRTCEYKLCYGQRSRNYEVHGGATPQ